MGIDSAGTGSADGLEIMGISSLHPPGVLMDVSTLLTSDNNPPKSRRKEKRGMNCVCAGWRAGHGELGECPVEVWGSRQEVSTKLPLEVDKSMSGTHGVGPRGGLVALESRNFSFITWWKQIIHQWCELLKSSMWQLSCEEEETSAVRPQVATAHLAKKFTQELPREIMMDKKGSEVHRTAEHPSDQQLHNCCPQPPCIVGAVFTLQRTKTDGNFISPGMHMSSQPLVSCFLSSLTFLSCPTHFLACISVGKRPFLSTSRDVHCLWQISIHIYHRVLVQLTSQCVSSRSAHTKPKIRT